MTLEHLKLVPASTSLYVWNVLNLAGVQIGQVEYAGGFWDGRFDDEHGDLRFSSVDLLMLGRHMSDEYFRGWVAW